MPSIIQAGNAASTGLVTTGATDGILELRSGTATGGTVAMTVDAAQNLTGATAGRLFGRSNILGTVSQTAGVPTGAIIERGSNANGEFVRFADGTQVCTFTATTNASTAAGEGLPLNHVPSAAFISQPAAYASASFYAGSDQSGVSLYGLTYSSNDINFSALNYGSGPAGVHPGFTTGTTTALSHRVFRIWIGRWF